jgi:hypothetical protein
MKNAGLAYAVLDHIDAHPEQWDQDVWMGKADCGTIACFAGWVCLLSGEEPDFDEWMELLDGKSVPERAEELLGAPRYLAYVTGDWGDRRDLFAGENTREQLGAYVEEIFGMRPVGEA